MGLLRLIFGFLDCSSAVNQDVCSIVSLDKSDISRYAAEESFISGGRGSLLDNQTDNEYSRYDHEFP